MNKSESIANIVKATINVMQAVKGIDKTMTIGTGSNSYKGVSDQEVKKTIGDAMVKNGLAIFPIGVEEKTQITEWDEVYNGNTRHRQSYMANVTTKYLLTHESGEFIEISGYGHGVDTQDKAAGKATTYALKYALLYTFMVPTGKIDDADNTHSDAIPTPPAKTEVKDYSLQINMLKECKTIEDLATVYSGFTRDQKAATLNIKEDMKIFFNAQK